MKKRILIISYYFAPNGEIGARRPTKIAEHLYSDGYSVDIFTYGYNGNDNGDETEIDKNVFRIISTMQNQSSNKELISPKEKASIISKLLFPLKRHYREYLAVKKQNIFLTEFKNHYKNIDISSKYDCVFSTYGPLASIKVGLYIKKTYPLIKWICDFRDPMVHEITPFLFKFYYKYIQNISCKKADWIITVSNGYLKRICGKKYSNKAKMIPNGFDKDCYSENQKEIITDKLIMTYVGSMYQGKRDFSALFKMLNFLHREKLIQKEKIIFEYAGHEIDYLLDQAKKFGMLDIIHDNGRLSHNDCIELERKSHILLLSTWNNKGEEGVFPGKFLEYLQFDRPIIAIIEGNKANSEVAQVINEGHLGIAYESKNKENDEHKLKDFLLAQYKNFFSKGFVFHSPVNEIISRYEYSTIIKRIEDIIDEE